MLKWLVREPFVPSVLIMPVITIGNSSKLCLVMARTQVSVFLTKAVNQSLVNTANFFSHTGWFWPQWEALYSSLLPIWHPFGTWDTQRGLSCKVHTWEPEFLITHVSIQKPLPNRDKNVWAVVLVFNWANDAFFCLCTNDDYYMILLEFYA